MIAGDLHIRHSVMRQRKDHVTETCEAAGALCDFMYTICNRQSQVPNCRKHWIPPRPEFSVCTGEFVVPLSYSWWL